MKIPNGYKNWLDVYKRHKDEVDNGDFVVDTGEYIIGTGLVAKLALEELVSLFPDQHTVKAVVNSKHNDLSENVYNQKGLLTQISEFLY